MKKLSLLLCSVVLAGCASKASVPTSGNYNVYTSYSNKIPGKYGLYVDGSDFEETVPCGAFSTSYDGDAAFRLSTFKTFENLFEAVELLDNPIDAQTAKNSGLDGIVLVRSKEADIDVNIGIGVEVEVELAASVEAFKDGERVLGATAEGDGEENLTGACPGLGENLGDAVGAAMKDLLGKLGEKVANEPRLR